ncbi:mitochondrial inheritance component mdm12 [Ceraceosorus bombacis]|uniref:Mitochondrial distribution and morphology protein 12 n=1 Tax=Ceraceosorus bombacis TaxID=401625 RepID=A0A0N7LBE8_9BASI|nr:mitochondrial inheritance component mdm12 [Ceraceosorus bombacis]
MSLDISWSLLDSALASQIQEKLNQALLRTTRPSFLGPIKISQLDFGSDAMDITLVDVGDVWRDFSGEVPLGPGGSPLRESLGMNSQEKQKEQQNLGQDDYRTRASSFDNAMDPLRMHGDRNVKVKHHAPRPAGSKPGQGLARFAERNLPFAGGAQAASYAQAQANPHADAQGVGAEFERGPRMQTYRQYGRGAQHHHPNGTGTSQYDRDSNWEGASLVGTPAPSGYGAWPGAGLGYARTPASVGAGAAYGYFPNFSLLAGRAASAGAAGMGRVDASSRLEAQTAARESPEASPSVSPSAPHPIPIRTRQARQQEQEQGLSQPEAATAGQLPPLQLHLALDWSTSTFRLTLQTSLLINHPSPAFMELPLSITVTSLVLQAGAVVAFEPLSSGKTVHLCLVEPELELEDEELDEAGEKQGGANPAAASARPSAATSSGPTLSLGEKLIPHLTLESSVGQADKHTLENVGKVEKFVLELIRKAVVDELVFPSAYTLELP